MSRAADIVARPPGHARVLGGPRSGKTSALIERFHHLTRAGHRPLVVAFGRDQRDRLLDALVPPGTARFGPVPVTTHGLLATRLVAATRSGARALRDVDERIVLDRVLAANPDLLRSDLRSISFSSTLRDELLRVLHLLAQNGVTPAQTRSAAKKSDDERARDVLALFAAYVENLRERGLVTFYDAAWEAARAVAADAALAAKAGLRDVVLVDDAHDLDAGQFALLRALAPPGGPVALELFGDTSGPRFSFRGTSDRFLVEEFPAAYGGDEFQLAPPCPTDDVFAACLDALRGAPPASGPAPAGAANAMAALPLFAKAPATPPTSEGRAWNARVHAVRASDEVAEVHHAARCVSEWLARGIAPGDIMVVARDPGRVASVVNHAFRGRGVPIETGTRADSAADAFVHALVGALGRDGDGRFAAALDSSPLLPALCDARGTPRDVVRTVAALRAAHATRDGFDLERLLREALAAVVPADASERVAQEWNRYAEVVTHAGGHPSLDEFRPMYLEAAAREPAMGDAVALVAARASSGRTARAAVVLGCADGLFPRVEVEGGYLPFAALSFALSGIHAGASRDFAARIDRERAEREENALLVSTLLCASEELCVSHPARSGDQALTVPPALAPLFARGVDVGRDTAPAFRAASLLAAAPADAALEEAVHAADRMSGGWIRPAGSPRRPRFERLALSPSRLETFCDCERKFFFQRILRIEEPATIYLTIGSVFHDVLKELVPVDASGDEVRAALGSDRANEVIDRVIADKMPDAGEWLRGLTRVHMQLMLGGVRELESKRQGTYRVLSVECDARVPVDGDAVLAGRVDRIDHMDGLGPVVIDYKTSAQLPKTAASILKGIENDRDYWQVVIYSVLAGALGHNAAAFVYYVVPPGEEVNALGVQFASGDLPHAIPGGGRNSRYDPMPPALLREVLDDAMRIHGSILSGACAYARTDDLQHCGNCHFIRVCRRTGA